MGVSVISSNYNGAKYLPKLLDTLNAQQGVEMEIIVVDRQSSDNSAEILARYPEVIVVTEPPQSGLVSGYDTGVAHAKYEHLFFCNEDMWFDPHCLRELESCINLEQRIGASDPWQWTYDGKHWIHGGVRFQPTSWDVNSPYPFRNFDATVDDQRLTEVPFPCAGALLIHRKMYDDVGGWDRSFFLDDEDVDFFLRAWQRDWKSVTAPEAKVYHAVGASLGNSVKIDRVDVSVKLRRYVSTCSNKSVIALKYFSFPAVFLAFFTWFVRLGNNIAKARFKYAGYDLVALFELMIRLPQALSFRAKNRPWNKKNPGERFFLAEEFQK